MKELMTILGPISYILSENFEKVFFISIIISGIILLFGFIVFISKLFTLSLKEIKQMLKKPTSIFVFITILLVVRNYFIKIFFYDIFLPIITIPITTILISRALTSFVANWKHKKLSWILTIFFGIGSFSVFIIQIVLLNVKPVRPEYSGLEHPGYQALAFFSFCIQLGIILTIISIIVNIIEKKRISKIKKILEEGN